MIGDVALLLVNIASTVAIIFVNKYVLRSFPYVMTLTLLHQIAGGMILAIQKCRCTLEKPLPSWVNYWFALLFISTVYAMNQSLRINTVTLYQILKLLVIPVQCLFQFLANKKVFSLYIYASLAILCLGVGLNTIAELDFQSSMFGLAIGLLSVFSVVLEQAEVHRLIAKLQCGAVDFLQSSLPHRVVLCSLVIVLTERDALKSLKSMQWEQVVWLACSCLLATSINITSVQIIGKFGPVTSAVVGHAKTMSIVILGFVMHPVVFDSTFLKQVTGVCIAMIGAIKYGQYSAFPDVDCWKASCQAHGSKWQVRNIFIATLFLGLSAALAFLLTPATTLPDLLLGKDSRELR